MTPTQELLRRIELKAQYIRLLIQADRIDQARQRVIDLERLAREERMGLDKVARG